jgi:hypothetical protein
MPGITYTPGTAWPTLPLGEVNLPLGWPQPRQGLPLSIDEQFQPGWMGRPEEQEIVFPQTIAREKRVYTTPPGGFYGSEVSPTIVSGVDYNGKTTIQLLGLRYHGDGVYAPAQYANAMAEGDYAYFFTQAETAWPSLIINHTWYIKRSTEYGLYTDVFGEVFNVTGPFMVPHKVPAIVWPIITPELMGWPADTVLTHTPFNVRTNFATGTEVYNFTAKAVERLSDGTPGYEERIILRIRVDCTIIYEDEGENLEPVQTFDELDLTGLSGTEILTHYSQPLPSLTPREANYYERTAWRGPGTILFP